MWAEVFGYICGAMGGYTFRLLWKETPHEIQVLHEQARRERERRIVDTAHAVMLLVQKDGPERLAKLEERGL